MKKVRLIFLHLGIFSTGLLITVDIKPDDVIKTHNRTSEKYLITQFFDNTDF